MADYSYFNNVITSLLRGMNSDAPWQQYYASNRITGSGFWFIFNLFGRFVLMRMFLESIAVSQVFSLRIRCSHSFLHTNVYPVRPTSGEVRRAGVARFQHTAPPARSMFPHATCSTRRIVFSAVCFPSCVAVSRLKSLLN
jgi:hypothetical protein